MREETPSHSCLKLWKSSSSQMNKIWKREVSLVMKMLHPLEERLRRSFSPDLPPLIFEISRKLASVVDVMSFSPEENMEKRFKKEIRKYTTEIKYVNKRGQITNKAEI